MANRASRIEIQTIAPGTDGKWHGRFPFGNNPLSLSGAALSASAGSGFLSGAGGSLKIHPGHYTQTNGYLSTSPESDGTFADVDRMAAVVDSSGRPFFKGYMAQFLWSTADIGISGFSPNAAFISAVNRLRTRLQTHYVYNGVVVPFRLMLRAGPGSPGTTNVPQWVITGISGQGSDGTPTSVFGGTGTAGCFWRTPVQQNWSAMWAYFGKPSGANWDADPFFEAVSCLRETSQQYDTPPPDYSTAAWRTQLNAMVATISAAWPTTIKTFGPNFGPSGTNQSYLNALVTLALNNGWAGGGPDLLTPATGETWGEIAQYGGSGSDGIDKRGLMPYIIGIEDDYYLWLSQVAATDEVYGFNTLEASHYVWMIFPTSLYGPGGPAFSPGSQSGQLFDSPNGVVASLSKTMPAFRIAPKGLLCPTNFHGQCNFS